MKKTYSTPVLTVVSNCAKTATRCGHGNACNGKSGEVL